MAYGPGKLILVGEHAVVYGHRAVAGAVSKGTTVQLQRRPGQSGIERANLIDARLWPALSRVLPSEGIGVYIGSELPTGCGMGSSAALAVACVRALAELEGREASFEECFREAFKIERYFHGSPSGIDHTVSAMGGLVAYKREGPVIEKLTTPEPLKLSVINTGTPGRSTAELVAGVRAREAELRPVIEEIGAIAEEGIAALQGWKLEELGRLMNENHRCLRALGVSTPELDAAVEKLRERGALGAKLAGAGGGGVVIGLGGEGGESMLLGV
jgi:mevalonate kinase